MDVWSYVVRPVDDGPEHLKLVYIDPLGFPCDAWRSVDMSSGPRDFKRRCTRVNRWNTPRTDADIVWTDSTVEEPVSAHDHSRLVDELLALHTVRTILRASVKIVWSGSRCRDRGSTISRGLMQKVSREHEAAKSSWKTSELTSDVKVSREDERTLRKCAKACWNSTKASKRYVHLD
jgi:hypothetical protein